MSSTTYELAQYRLGKVRKQISVLQEKERILIQLRDSVRSEHIKEEEVRLKLWELGDKRGRKPAVVCRQEQKQKLLNNNSTKQ